MDGRLRGSLYICISFFGPLLISFLCRFCSIHDCLMNRASARSYVYIVRAGANKPHRASYHGSAATFPSKLLCNIDIYFIKLLQYKLEKFDQNLL